MENADAKDEKSSNRKVAPEGKSQPRQAGGEPLTPPGSTGKGSDDQAVSEKQLESTDTTEEPQLSKGSQDENGKDDANDLSSGSDCPSDYPNRSYRRKTMKQKIEMSKKRVKQFKNYAQLVEERMTDLEAKYHEIQGILFQKTDEDLDIDKEEEAKTVLKAEIMEVEWDKWEEETGHVLDILTGPTGEPQLLQSEPGSVQTKYRPEHIPKGYAPERIRVNSRPLAYLVDRLIDSQGSGALYLSSKGFTYMRPYRSLIRSDDRIRAYCRVLESFHGQQSSAQHAKETVENSGEESPTNSKTTGSKDMVHAEPTLANVVPDQFQNLWNKDEGIYHTEEIMKELQCFIRFMDQYLADLFLLRDLIRDKKIQTISFDNLWMLFNHGDEVCSRQEQMQLYKVFHTNGGRSLDRTRQAKVRRSTIYFEDNGKLEMYRAYQRVSMFEVHCYHIDFDGQQLGPVHKSFLISKFDGEKPVRALDVYPLYFESGHAEIEKRMLKRGMEFLALAKTEASHKEYQGVSIDDSAEEINGPVMIDFQLAYSTKDRRSRKPRFSLPNPPAEDPREVQLCDSDYHEGPGCIFCRYDNAFPDRTIEGRRSIDFTNEVEESLENLRPYDVLGPDLLKLLPGSVWAFIFRSRKWRKLEVHRLDEVGVGDTGLKDLVLPKGYKRLVESLVVTHLESSHDNKMRKVKNEYDHDYDVVKGKGKGLVILLHGAPGVGKTATAECVAALTRRPLFPVTCGDIGILPNEVEENLSLNFSMAHRWNCVLLLDEADVFLQARNLTDLKRNSLVSVFLRVLEYYPGILFLTTNRIAAFDEAFKSRIHMQLYYPNLTKDAYLKVWETQLHSLRKHESKASYKLEIEEDEIMKFAGKEFQRLKWNGRQVRNAFQTAMALAEYETFFPEGTNPISTEQMINDAKEGRQIVKLTVEKFRKVAKAASGFDDYLMSIFGKDDAERAKHDALRNDFYSTPQKPTVSEANMKGAVPLPPSEQFEYSDVDDEEGKAQAKREKDKKRKAKKEKKKREEEKQRKLRKEMEKKQKELEALENGSSGDDDSEDDNSDDSE